MSESLLGQVRNMVTEVKELVSKVEVRVECVEGAVFALNKFDLSAQSVCHTAFPGEVPGGTQAKISVMVAHPRAACNGGLNPNRSRRNIVHGPRANNKLQLSLSVNSKVCASLCACKTAFVGKELVPLKY